MMHAKSESDVTSLAPSSPSRSPKRAAYYVQSPSRDSHDGDKSSTMQATPVYNSPLESPAHPSYGRHSRTSSGSRFSGTLRSWSGRKMHKKRNEKGWNEKGWPECNVIQEEGDFDDLDKDKRLTRRCQIMMGFVAFVLFFASICLIIWGATRQYKPDVVMKSMAVYNFYVGEGTDHTGVPTDLITANCSLKLSVYNSAPTFGIHVSSSPMGIKFSEITVATGQLERLYIRQKSRRTVSAVIQGEKVPVYGASSGLSLSSAGGPVPLTLELDVITRGYVMGKLVKTTHKKHISCKFNVDSAKTKTLKFSKRTCTYT